MTKKEIDYAIYGLLIFGILVTAYAAFATNGISSRLQPSQQQQAIIVASTPSPTPPPAKLSLTLITAPNCTECADSAGKLSALLKTMSGISIESEKNISYDKAGSLIEKYGIEKVPTLLIQGETSKATQLLQAWPQVGNQSSDGTLVFTAVQPPFIELSTGDIRGLVDLIVLNASNCSSCYNATMHEAVLQQSFGMALANVSYYDASSKEGKKLVSQYNVTFVPTAIVGPEASQYPSFLQVWQSVGTVEEDGWFIFRNALALGNATIFNLTTGKTENVSASSSQTQTQ